MTTCDEGPFTSLGDDTRRFVVSRVSYVVYRSRMDQIHIRDLVVSGIIGINPGERVNKQDVLVNVTLSIDTRVAAASDDIVDAVNYRTITKSIIAHIETGKPMLVERLAQEIADICLSDARVSAAEVTIEKPGALRHARSVGITIKRNRVDHSA